jgi:hypothetical protein
MTTPNAIIARNYDSIRRRMASACERTGRSASDVRLVAVTKYAEPAWIDAILALGIQDLGESRPQQLIARASALGQSIRWHLVGHLQRNKVRPVLAYSAWIHSVDTVSLLQRLDATAGELHLRPRILLEVNASGETSKSGFRPEELVANWKAVIAASNLQVTGLMTMAPLAEDPETIRPVFARLCDLRRQLALRSPPEFQLFELSMGMSNDFEVAIEEGATMIRIGTALFEGLSMA